MPQPLSPSSASVPCHYSSGIGALHIGIRAGLQLCRPAALLFESRIKSSLLNYSFNSPQHVIYAALNKKMARVIETEQKLTQNFYTFEDGAEGGVLDFEASFRLAYGLPPCWRRRVLQVLGDTVYRDPDTMAEIGDFPRYCSMILRIWALYRGCLPVDVAAPSHSPGPPDPSVQQSVEVDAGMHVSSFIPHVGTHDTEAGPSGTQADQTDGSVPPRAQDDRDGRCDMMEDETDDEDTDEEDPVEDEIVYLTGD
ncbi:hypothetical protein C2S52_001770 [Perilla frutescens var. hirtella]|nr:hypothetical protein C2S52_001770 [Perilla frutescens var. hirtella]